MPKKIQILVIGHNGTIKPKVAKIAYETGAEVARSGAVLITGGMEGVMKEACRGAKDAGGLTVGIIPQSESSFANEYCDIVIPSGMGLARDFLNALSGDGVIIIGGGSGTLSETCAAYMHKRPIVAIKNSGGIAEKYADTHLDHRKSILIIGVSSPQEAVKVLLEKINST